MLISVCDKMQSGYTYELTEPMGENFSPLFKPELAPQQMLELGVRFIGMWRNLKRIALWLILLVVHDKDKRCYSGRIIRLFDENLL